MIESVIEKVKKQSNKVVFLVGQSGTGKTKILLRLSKKFDYLYINLNYELSKKLTEISEEKPNWENIISDIINAQLSDVFLFDNSELLFTKDFDINPIQLLKILSRKKVIVMAWNGEFKEGNLTYANPGDDDYRKFDSNDLDGIKIIPMSDLR
jgi:hypothetical protein